MANISGPGGNFTGINGFNANVAGWSGSLNVTIVETTGFADVGNRVFDPTAVSISGSAVGTGISGNGSNSAPALAAGLGATPVMGSYVGTLTLTFTTGCTWAFPATVSGVSAGRVFDGKSDVGFSFVSRGAITQTWA